MPLSSRYTRGIEIQIGGNTTRLKTALDQANRSIRTTQTELDTLRNSLKLEWDPSRFQRAQQLAQRAIDETKAKADVLRKALEAMGDPTSFSATQKEQYEAIRRELSYVEVAAQKAQAQLEELNNVPLDRLKQSLTDAGDRLSRLGAGLTAGVTAPLTAAGAAAVKYASDTEEALNKVDVAFGASAESVRSWSEGTLNSIGLARGTALDMAALFGDMATSMGYGREEAAQMSMALVDLAADLSSFKNVGIDQVSTALKSIFTGETESLKELGVVMTQANLEAYALAQGYTTAYTAMDQAQQVAVRYQYVLDRTSNAQGDFARTSDSTANQLRIFRESLKEAAATAGEELLPVITPIIERLNDLIQSFGDLDEGTRKAVVQAGLFLAALGPMMTAVGGVTKAVSAGITVYQSLRTALTAATAATTAATAAQTGLNAAMAANPVGAVVTAVWTLVAVLGSLVVSTALTTESTQTLTASINEARQAYADARAEIQTSQAEALSMADALVRLAEEEHKSAAEKAALLELVDQLNEAVPTLSLAYDAQTDSLNLTAEAIRALTEAEYARQEQEAAAERLSGAYQEQITIAEELLAAEDALQAARERYAAFEGTEARNAKESVSMEAAKGQLIAAQGAYDRLTKAQQENEAEIAALEKAYGKYSGAADQAADATGGVGSAARQTADRLTALTTVLGAVQGGYELLAQAQEQQSETGYLELDTVTRLLEEYPNLAGYLEEAAGGYRLAEGALQDYMATQRAEYALAVNEARTAALELIKNEQAKAEAIGLTNEALANQLRIQAEEYQAMGANADNRAEGDSYYAIANQYRDAANAIESASSALEEYDRISASLRREHGSSGSSSRRTSSTAKAETRSAGETAMEEFQAWLDDMDHQIFLWSKDESKVQAIADLYQAMMDRAHQVAQELRAQGYQDTSDEIQQLQELWWGWAEERESLLTSAAQAQAAQKQQAYQEELADLQYFLDMGLIGEEEYYVGLARLRDQYLEENSEAWRQANVDLHNYLERVRQEELDAAQEAYEAQLKAMEEAYEAQVAALKEALAEEKAALKDRYDAEKEAAQEAYEARKAQIETELEAEKERLNTVLEGIDREIQARKELREDEEQEDAIAAAQKRLEAAQAQLAFARDEEDRLEWQKEVARLQEALDQAIQDREDTLFYREKEEEKEQVQDQIDAAEEAAQEQLDQAKADYEAKLDALEASYQQALADLEARYERAMAAAQSAYERGSGGGGGSKGQEAMDPEILEIARNEHVEYGIAKDMYETNQANKDNPDYVPYGTKSSGAAERAARAAATLAGAVESAAQSISRTVSQVTKNNSASITYNAGGGMTEGQVARTVRKVLDELDR